jgi:glycine reductase
VRLELANYPVKEVSFGPRTTYRDGILQLERDGLLGLIREDRRIEAARLELAFPGDKTRIVNVRDVVEPRVKISGSGSVFPGVLAPVETVGGGKTCRLSKIAVILSAEYKPTILSGVASQNAGIIDMWGPGSKLTPFGATTNLIPVLKLIDGISEIEAHAAMQLAEFKVARRVAETVRDLAPQEVGVYELSKTDPALPRVAYILSFLTSGIIPSLVSYYGFSIREALPFQVHPNELFDGALTGDTRHGCGDYITTWHWMNQPVVERLFKEHGKRLTFVGLVLQRTRFEAELGKQVTAAGTSQMAKLMEADGVIITRTTRSGANLEDVMLTVQGCEKKGIKTVLLGPEWGGKGGPAMIFCVPEATAMVTTGSHETETRLPAPERVIGLSESGLIAPQQGDKPFSPWDELAWEDTRYVTGGIDWFGIGTLTAKEF